MAHGALIEHRPWLFASLVAGVAYYFLWNNPIGGVWLIALKGAGVGFLALYALRRTSGIDGALLTLVLALGAAADMVLEIDFQIGGGLFFAAHMVAVCLFLRNRDSSAARNRMLAGAAMLVAAPAVSYLLSGDPFIALYATALGAMAATACTSRFPFERLALAASLFIMSDWLIFSRMGPFDLSPLPDILIWPAYYAAQFMIATGVVQTLRSDHES